MLDRRLLFNDKDENFEVLKSDIEEVKNSARSKK